MFKKLLLLSITIIVSCFVQLANAGTGNQKVDAVATMIKMIRTKERPVFAVMINKYYIEGRPYRSFMFTVSSEHTSDIKQTDNGFVTTGIFRESMVHKEAKAGKKIKNGLVKVQMQIKYEDIWAVSGKTIKGKKIELLNNSDSKVKILQ